MTTDRIRRGCIQCGIIVLIPLALFAIYTAAAPYIARSAPQLAAINGLNPSSAVAGGADFVLTITASDFDTNTVRVLWNSALLLGSFAVNTSTVTVTVPAANIAVAGYASVVLTDAVNGLTNPATFTVLNPAPAIGSASPLSVTAGNAFTVTITGSGFVTSTAVNLASIPLSVSGQTSVTLTAIAASGLFTRSGSYTLTVSNPAPGGGSAASEFMVLSAAPEAVHISPPAATLAVNAQQLFTASGADAYGNTVSPLTVTWALSPAISGAIVSTGALTMAFRAGTAPGIFPAGIMAGVSGITGTADLTVTAGPLAAIHLTPAGATLAPGGTQLFTASGTDSLGNPVTPVSVSWVISPGVAGSVVSSGPLTAEVSSGTTAGYYPSAVQASTAGITGTAALTVTAGALSRIDVVPAAAVLSVHASTPFTATGYDAYGNTVAPLTVTWSTVTASVGIVTPTGPLNAIFQAGAAPGIYPAAVRASAGGLTGTADVTVTAGTLQVIRLAPASATLGISATQTFTASGEDAFGNAVALPAVTWSVTPAVAGSVVSSGPLTAEVSSGTTADYYPAAIRTTLSGVTGTADLTVTAGALSRIDVIPASAALAVNATAPFTATGYDAYGNPIAPLSVTWSVTPSVAGSVLSFGPLTATFQAGTVAGTYLGALRATASGVMGTADIVVAPGALNSIVVTPPSRTLSVTASAAFTAAGYDTYGNAVAPLSVTWSVSPSVAGSVLSFGTLTATFQAGTVAGTYLSALRATAFGVTGTADITVAPGALASISIAPPSRTLSVTASGAFTATGYDGYGNLIAPLSVTWSVTPGTAGSVLSFGPLTATFQAGTVAGTYLGALRATASGVMGTADIVVAPGALNAITLTPGAPAVVVSTTQVFTAVGTDIYGNILPSLSVTWSIAPVAAGRIVSSQSLTLVMRAGTVAGLYTAAIRATAYGVTAAADLTVVPGALASLTLSPNAATLPVYTAQTFTALGYDSYGNWIMTLSPNWSFSSAAGTITSQSWLTAEFRTGTVPGTYPAAIRASSAGITATADITVVAGPVYRISLDPLLVSLPISTSQLFTATAYDIYSNVVPGQSMLWSALPGAGAISSYGPLTASFMSGPTPGTYFNAVQATVNGVVGSADIIVREGAVAQVIITPSVATLPVNAQQLFTATVVDAANNPLDLPVTWLPPTGGTIQSSGTFTMLLRAGTLAQYFSKGVQAAQGIVIGTADLNVTPGALASIVLTPSAASLPVSATQLFTAVGSDVYGNNIPGFSVLWSVSPTLAGAIQSSAGVTAVFRSGTLVGAYAGAIRARNGSISDTSDIAVLPGTLARITVTPTAATLAVNATAPFTASGFDRFGNAVSGINITWTVAPAQAGAIVSSGPVTALFQAGIAAGIYPDAVMAHSGALTASADVTVVAGALASITINPATTSLAISGTQNYTASGADVYGNAVPGLALSWSADSAAGRIILSGTTTATLRAGTQAGSHPQAVRASQGGVTGTADVTVRPDPPAQLTVQASPVLIRTDGISRSLIAVNVFDRYGNAISAGAAVSLAVNCAGQCVIAPAWGTTGADGTFTAALTSTLRSVTQTVGSTIRLTATVSPAVAPGGLITGLSSVSGVFTPFRTYLPLAMLRYQLNNHTVCTAEPLTPPATVIQPADQFNLYRFTATASSYDFQLQNYPSSGNLIVYQIVADNCASSSSMDVNTIASTGIIAGQPLQWSTGNIMTPGLQYLVFVYNASGSNPALYTLSISPSPALNLGLFPLPAARALPGKTFTVDSTLPQSALLAGLPGNGDTTQPQGP